MPVATLFIEGKLDAELLNSIFQGNPVLKIGGSKSNLKTRARAECENKITAGYLRDRDFDYDPPTTLSSPALDCDNPPGWRWCRHEIENYLIEPSLISEAMGFSIIDVHDAICNSANKIKSYEAARWAVGIVRRALPPSYELETRPDNLKEIAFPQQSDISAVSTWALKTIEAHRIRITDAIEPSRVNESLQYFLARFDNDFIADISNVLLWFSGKDILAGMDEWLKTKNFYNPGLFRASIRDWVIAHPERTLELLPEWQSLARTLQI